MGSARPTRLLSHFIDVDPIDTAVEVMSVGTVVVSVGPGVATAFRTGVDVGKLTGWATSEVDAFF